MSNRKKHKKDFIDIIENNKGIIHKISLIYTSNFDDKEDLYQEICLQLWRSYGNFRGEAKLSTWLYRVALNTAISTIRRKNRFIETVKLDPQKHYNIKDNEKDEMTASLLRAIALLGNIDRAIVILWLEEKKYEEISEVTGLSKSAVSVRLVRIRTKLENLIKKVENE